jgi:hypothetical protein
MLSRASRDASLRVTFVVVVVVSACGSSSLFHFLQRLADSLIVAEIESVVCRLKGSGERDGLDSSQVACPVGASTDPNLWMTKNTKVRDIPFVMYNNVGLCSQGGLSDAARNG